jgi:hypothetical protein
MAVCGTPVPEFDGRIKLITEENGQHVHVYLIDGIRNDGAQPDHVLPYVSSTAFAHRFLPEFDGPLAARRTVRGANWSASRFRADAERRAREELSGRAAPPPLLPRDAHAVYNSYLHGDETLGGLLAALQPQAQRRLVQCIFEPLWIKSLCTDYRLAGEYGTLMHSRIEGFFNGEYGLDRMLEFARTGAPDGSGGEAREYAHFARFYTEWLTARGLRPFRMELYVFDEELRMCGAVDGLFYDPAFDDDLHLIMIDKSVSLFVVVRANTPQHWKRCYGMTEGFLPPGLTQYWCKPPLQSLPECKFTGHALQQRLYQYMIEKRTRYTVSQSWLAVFHPTNASYIMIPVPPLKQEVATLCALRATELEEARDAVKRARVHYFRGAERNAAARCSKRSYASADVAGSVSPAPTGTEDGGSGTLTVDRFVTRSRNASMKRCTGADATNASVISVGRSVSCITLFSTIFSTAPCSSHAIGSLRTCRPRRNTADITL